MSTNEGPPETFLRGNDIGHVLSTVRELARPLTPTNREVFARLLVETIDALDAGRDPDYGAIVGDAQALLPEDPPAA